MLVKKIAKVCVSVVTVIFFLAAVIILILGIQANRSNKPLKIFGYSYSVVMTESMLPEIKPGDFLLTYDEDFANIKEGMDIVYKSEINNIYIVHRVLERSSDGSTLTVKGINNEYPDDEKVTVDNYFGVVKKHGNILSLGKLVIDKKNFVYAIIVIIFLVMVLTEGFNIFRIIKEEKMRQEEEEHQKRLEQAREEIKKELEAEFKGKNNLANPPKGGDAKL